MKPRNNNFVFAALALGLLGFILMLGSPDSGRDSGSPGVGHPALAGSGSHASLDSSAPHSVKPNRQRLAKTFLFIGVISGRNMWQRRAGCREAWAVAAQVPEVVTTKFFVPDAGKVDEEGRAELQQQKDRDLVLIPGEHTYSTISLATLAVFEHVVDDYDFNFVLKTDDDSFINVPALIQKLRTTCEQPDCKGERVYMGYEMHGMNVKDGYTQDVSRNIPLFNYTMMPTYPRYMVGGGYILSDDVARMLLTVHRGVGIKMFVTAIEDALFGFYLSTWDLRHIHDDRFWTLNSNCCSEQSGGHLKLNERARDALCGPEPPFVMHKVVDPAAMRLLGKLSGTCSNAISLNAYKQIAL